MLWRDVRHVTCCLFTPHCRALIELDESTRIERVRRDNLQNSRLSSIHPRQSLHHRLFTSFHPLLGRDTGLPGEYVHIARV